MKKKERKRESAREIFCIPANKKSEKIRDRESGGRKRGALRVAQARMQEGPGSGGLSRGPSGGFPLLSFRSMQRGHWLFDCGWHEKNLFLCERCVMCLYGALV